jgi:predicted nucleic acid-binding protein
VLFLLDKSAHELARRHPDARRTFETIAMAGVLATCAIAELEILYSARNPTDHRRLQTYLRQQCVWLAAGMHRKPIPDLIIASGWPTPPR